MVVCGVVVGISRHPTPRPLVSPVSGCPRPFPSAKFQWCIEGTANGLPFKMTLFTAKGAPPFLSTIGGTRSLGFSHIVGQDCGAGAVASGSLVVPIFMALDQNAKRGPTGGTSPAVYDLVVPGSFYTNPAGSTSSDASTRTIIDYLSTGWRCGTRSFVGFGNKGQSTDESDFLGFLILSGWSQFPWKEYMLQHLELFFLVHPPAFYPASQNLYRGGGVARVTSHIVHAFGPRLSVVGHKGFEVVKIQILSSSYTGPKAKKSVV